MKSEWGALTIRRRVQDLPLVDNSISLLTPFAAYLPANALGASGVQIGTAYLRCAESKLIAPARTALAQAHDDSTVITNVMTGRPARGVANRVMREVGPISPDAPAFPHAATGLAPLKAAAEKLGKVDFTNLWAGQAVRMGREMPAAELTRALAGAALARLQALSG